jgi:hypothetical protein
VPGLRPHGLDVVDVAKSWPESEERRRAWFSVANAADVVAEPELKALLRALEPSA